MLRNTFPRVPMATDSGFTLVEFAVTSVIGVVATLLVSSVMINSINVEAQVRNVTSANAIGQVAYKSLDNSGRNSMSMAVTSVGSDLLLRAVTIGSGTTAAWGCAAWFYSATDKTLRYKASSSAIAAPTSTASQRSWTLLSKNVSAVTGSPVFSIATNGAGGQTLTSTFRISSQGTAAPTFKVVTSNRVMSTAEGVPACF